MKYGLEDSFIHLSLLIDIEKKIPKERNNIDEDCRKTEISVIESEDILLQAIYATS